jgi:hypothetical protein
VWYDIAKIDRGKKDEEREERISAFTGLYCVDLIDKGALTL